MTSGAQGAADVTRPTIIEVVTGAGLCTIVWARQRSVVVPPAFVVPLLLVR
jgi:hypothetical protein